MKLKSIETSIQKKSPNYFGDFLLFFNSSYSTVTDFAKFLGWSTLHPLIKAM